MTLSFILARRYVVVIPLSNSGGKLQYVDEEGNGGGKIDSIQI